MLIAATEPTRRADLTDTRFVWELCAGAAVVLVATVLASVRLAQSIDDRLARLSERARRFANGGSIPEPVPGDDGFAQVDAALRGMRAAIDEGRTALERANERSNRKSEFVATLGHEIRTPMNGVIGMSELLLQTPLSNEQHDYADAVHWSGLALLKIVNDLLDFSKIEAGRLDLDCTDFDLVETVESVTTLLSSQAKAKGLILMSYVAPAVPRIVRGDSVRLRQVLLNLIGNALKFTERGSVIVEVRAEPDAGTGDARFCFSVKDTGIGIDPAAGSFLFEPYAQADGSTTRRFGGTGLGLAISRSLVRKMDGELTFVSQLGAGSTFSFTIALPRAALAESRITSSDGIRGASALVADDDALACNGDRPERILLVEDNMVNVRLALRQLAKLGFNAVPVSNGRAAVDHVKANRYDVVFMDCHMPVLDGFVATAEIRKLESRTGRRVPIVAMTANARSGDRDECLAAGMDDYLSKPVTLADLQRVLDRWLGAAAELVSVAVVNPED